MNLKKILFILLLLFVNIEFSSAKFVQFSFKIFKITRTGFVPALEVFTKKLSKVCDIKGYVYNPRLNVRKSKHE